MADLAHTDESLKRENDTLKRAYQKLLSKVSQSSRARALAHAARSSDTSAQLCHSTTS